MLLVALKPLTEKIFKEAKEQGRNEPSEAYAADALVRLAEDGHRDDRKPSSGPRAMVQVLIDHSALTRGYLMPGERSEIAGVGPISVASAKSLMSDSILSAVILNGVDVTTVSHLGRTIPAHLRTALVARDQTCVVPGCDVRWPLHIDHAKPLSEGGVTCLSNLDLLCSWHHYLKTHRHYVLAGGPGTWRFGPSATSRGP
ncbi:MAG: HNH endonuclease [Actinobacteria bacterium]|nr:HNH endonuclease [Actinomycetota bacterium]